MRFRSAAGLGFAARSGLGAGLGLGLVAGLLWALGSAVGLGSGVGLGLVVGSGPGAGLETGFAAGFGSVLEPGLVAGLRLPVVGPVTEVRTGLGSVAGFEPSTVVFGEGLGVESMPLTLVDVGGGTGLVCWAVAGSGLVLVELGLVFGVRTESGDEFVSGPC
ncbi:hypothetical protein [Amycolatopsis sp. La24]|uniref:hypothetical protein n=1 Tax=Amycolatopsis sp. La24 TaxID=3028304 RepID=UPI0023B195CC|nr:hypothetical protein [Amycolatopsis sp. La24]